MAEESLQESSGSPGPGAKQVHVGRRTVLGMLGLAGIGIVVGKKIDTTLGGVSSAVSNAIGVPLPGDNDFRYYTVTNSYPVIPAELQAERRRHGPPAAPAQPRRPPVHEKDGLSSISSSASPAGSCLTCTGKECSFRMCSTAPG